MSSENSSRSGTPLLKLESVTKAFPGVVANDSVDLTIHAGQIHALLGENGAGKSTLVKIIYGLLKADSGRLVYEGEPVAISSPREARRRGIGMVFQHFSLFEALSVSENILLGMEPDTDRGTLNDRIREVSESYGLPLDPDREVHALSVGERQRIEVVRCLLQKPRLLIMDEPTSVLTPQEVDRLFDTLRRLASEGCAILYISHKLDEIKALCEVATILRGGKRVGEYATAGETPDTLAEKMIGGDLTPPVHSAKQGGEIYFRVSNLSRPAESNFAVSLKNLNLEVRQGEVFGIAGVAGNGQTEMLEAFSGEFVCSDPQTVEIKGRPCGDLGINQRRQLGMAFVPEERLGHGAVPEMSLVDNTVLSGYRVQNLAGRQLIDYPAARRATEQICSEFNVKQSGIGSAARSLSGGNLQKFIVGREILQNPEILIASQPTWGVDAGSAAAIHQALIHLAEQGAAVLVVSQDLDELLAISDRIAVIFNGDLSKARAASEVTAQSLGLLMGGASDTGDAAERVMPGGVR